MTYMQERDEFIAIAAVEGLDVGTARLLLRHSSTIQRLAEASCNGDYPADNGTRPTVECPECGTYWHPASFKRARINGSEPRKVCPDCQTETRVKSLLPQGFTAIFGGDPRGCCLKITVPSGRTNDGGREGICVPARTR